MVFLLWLFSHNFSVVLSHYSPRLLSFTGHHSHHTHTQHSVIICWPIFATHSQASLKKKNSQEHTCQGLPCILSTQWLWCDNETRSLTVIIYHMEWHQCSISGQKQQDRTSWMSLVVTCNRGNISTQVATQHILYRAHSWTSEAEKSWIYSRQKYYFF